MLHCVLQTQSFVGLLTAKLLDQVLRVLGDLTREVNSFDALQNDVVRLHRIASRERRPKTQRMRAVKQTAKRKRVSGAYSHAGEQLIHENAQRPVISRQVMTLVQDNLRRDVLQRIQ